MSEKWIDLAEKQQAEIDRLKGVVREWERDMKGTLNTLEAERQKAARLLESLKEVTRICEALRFTAGLGKNQLERIERAKAAIAEATGRAAA